MRQRTPNMRFGEEWDLGNGSQYELSDQNEATKPVESMNLPKQAHLILAPLQVGNQLFTPSSKKLFVKGGSNGSKKHKIRRQKRANRESYNFIEDDSCSEYDSDCSDLSSTMASIPTDSNTNYLREENATDFDTSDPSVFVNAGYDLDIKLLKEDEDQIVKHLDEADKNQHHNEQKRQTALHLRKEMNKMDMKERTLFLSDGIFGETDQLKEATYAKASADNNKIQGIHGLILSQNELKQDMVLSNSKLQNEITKLKNMLDVEAQKMLFLENPYLAQTKENISMKHKLDEYDQSNGRQGLIIKYLYEILLLKKEILEIKASTCNEAGAKEIQNCHVNITDNSEKKLWPIFCKSYVPNKLNKETKNIIHNSCNIGPMPKTMENPIKRWTQKDGWKWTDGRSRHSDVFKGNTNVGNKLEKLPGKSPLEVPETATSEKVQCVAKCSCNDFLYHGAKRRIRELLVAASVPPYLEKETEKTIKILM